MKYKKLIFAVLFCLGGSLYAQKDTLWFDAEWKLTQQDAAVFVRVAEFKELHFKEFYPFTDFDSLGVKLKEGITLDKNTNAFEGEIVYFENGDTVKERILYKNGAPYGAHKTYYPSGKIKSIKNYVFGVLKGGYKSYYENGNLFEVGAYLDNKRNGTWKVYYTNRKLKEQGQYKNDVRVGVWKVFYYNGLPQE